MRRNGRGSLVYRTFFFNDLPVLFFYLSNLWAGLAWSVALFVVLIIGYLFYPEINNKAPVSQLVFIHTTITYIAGILIGGFFELKRNPARITFLKFFT